MKRVFCTGLLVVSLSVGAAGNAAAGFINGSFETGDLTGWTSTLSGYNPFFTFYGAGMDGTYWHWLAGYEALDTATYQTLTGLTAGVTYAVDFIMASEGDNSDSLRVSVDGQAGTVFTAPPRLNNGTGNGLWDNWVGQKYLFTATGTTAKVQFDTIGLNRLCCDVGLDNVRLSVTDSPEPGTLVLLALGISGLSLLRPGRAVRN